ncbi:hypothetical protein [Dyella sp. 20L07]|uniref:hypothetical protein n=1 Tax=Dyella sp. 20L07 TaxID=3384240 RepID=UPI003D286F46
MRPVLIALAACLLGGSALATPADSPFRDFTDLIGHWSCRGAFPASGKAIEADMRFESDLGGKALLKHHDDTLAPALYHAVEAWGYDAKADRYSAAITDNFGGARIFSSVGWVDGALTWTSATEVKPAQRFRYTRLSSDQLRVDWEVEKQGSMVIGDTLTCERVAANQGSPSKAR